MWLEHREIGVWVVSCFYWEFKLELVVNSQLNTLEEILFHNSCIRIRNGYYEDIIVKTTGLFQLTLKTVSHWCDKFVGAVG